MRTSILSPARDVGVGLNYTESLLIKKLREVRKTNGLKFDQEEAEPNIGKNFKTNSRYRMN